MGSPHSVSDEPLAIRPASASAAAVTVAATGRAKTGTPMSVAPNGGGPFDVDNMSMSSGNSSVFAERARTLASPSYPRTDGVQKIKLVSDYV